MGLINVEQYKGFIFDLNGTMIDDMQYHINAWHRILNKLGADITLEKTKEECYGKNHELLERVFPARFSDEEKDNLSVEKETKYQAEFKPHLQLIDGLDELLHQAYFSGIKMAIGSAAILYNINFVLDGLDIRKYFDAIVSAEDVVISKPHPETFLKCAEALNIPAANCLVFEDAPKGVEAALNAGMDCVVITTMHNKGDFNQYDNVIGFIKQYNQLLLKQAV